MDVPTTMVKPGEGRSVWLGGMGVVFKVSGADTGGVFAVVEHPSVGYGRFPPLQDLRSFLHKTGIFF